MKLLRAFGRWLWGDPPGDGHAEVRRIGPELRRRPEEQFYDQLVRGPVVQPPPRPRSPRLGAPLAHAEVLLRCPVGAGYEVRFRVAGGEWTAWRLAPAHHRFPPTLESLEVRKRPGDARPLVSG